MWGLWRYCDFFDHVELVDDKVIWSISGAFPLVGASRITPTPEIGIREWYAQRLTAVISQLGG